VYFPAGHVVSDSVNIYLTNLRAADTARVLNVNGYTYFDEEVIVTVTYSHPVSRRTAIMTSSNTPIETAEVLHGARMVKPNFVETRLPSERFAVATQLLPGSLSDHGQQTYLAYQAFKSIPVIFEGNGSVYGHLPSVSIEAGPVGSLTTVLAKFASKTGPMLRALTNNTEVECLGGHAADPFGNRIFPGWKCFSELSNASVTKYTADEYLRDVGAELNNEQVAYINPSTTNNNFDYVWRSTACCNLEPVFKLTDPTAADSQSKAAFTSGIAFGVAGAALIAVFQELPKEFPWPRRREDSDAA
jgi:hypothetical protein